MISLKKTSGLLLSLSTALLLTACGGDSATDNNTTPNDNKENGFSTLVMNQKTIATGSQCVKGGIEIDTGVDINKNGQLDADEVSDTYTLCHGSDGQNGLVAMINTEKLSEGLECSLGGIKIQSGMDINGNALLDSNEVTSTSSICNYNNGAVDGFSALVDLTDEAAGANCAFGGQRIATGNDTNRNAVLDAEEVLKSKYLCDGASGENGDAALVSLVDELAGGNCTNGGVRVDAGLDTSGDGTLQQEEVTSQNYICKGLDGESALSSLVDVNTVAVGEICAQGGQKIISGLDVNDNGLLDGEEISRTAYVCNGSGSGDSSPNAERQNFISYDIEIPVDTETYALCQTDDNYNDNYSSKREYYDLDTGIAGEPYATCTNTYCSNYNDGLITSLNVTTGADGCQNSYQVHYECSKEVGDLVFNEDKTACVEVTPVCSSNNIALCDTEMSCTDMGGKWWESSCSYYCPQDSIDTSRGCESPASENTCTGNQILQDNVCTDVTFTEITGDICGDYDTPILIKTGSHLLSCNTEFKDLVVFEAGTTINVDSNWTINARNIRINGTDAQPVIIKPSDNNPQDSFNGFTVNGNRYNYTPARFDRENGYISGSRIDYLEFSGASLNVTDVTMRQSTVSSYLQLSGSLFEESIVSNLLNVSGSIVKSSTLSTQIYYVNFEDSYVLNSEFTAAEGGTLVYLVRSIALASDFNSQVDYSSRYSYGSSSGLHKPALMFSTTDSDNQCNYNYSFGNHYTAETLPEGCADQDNSLTGVSDKYAAYILGSDDHNAEIGSPFTPSTYILNKHGFVNSADVVWKVRYDRDGETIVLPESWQGYNPSIVFDQRESYELYIHSINGDTDIIGHRVINVDVQK